MWQNVSNLPSLWLPRATRNWSPSLEGKSVLVRTTVPGPIWWSRSKIWGRGWEQGWKVTTEETKHRLGHAMHIKQKTFTSFASWNCSCSPAGISNTGDEDQVIIDRNIIIIIISFGLTKRGIDNTLPYFHIAGTLQLQVATKVNIWFVNTHLNSLLLCFHLSAR